MSRSIKGAIAVLALLCSQPATSQDISSIEATLRGNMCPPAPVEQPEISEFCAGRTICLDKSRNGSDCGGGHLLVGYEKPCADEFRRQNELILAYNQRYRTCQSSGPASSAPPSWSGAGSSRAIEMTRYCQDLCEIAFRHCARIRAADAACKVDRDDCLYKC